MIEIGTIWFVFFTLLLICSVKLNLLSKDTSRSFPALDFFDGDSSIGDFHGICCIFHIISDV